MLTRGNVKPFYYRILSKFPSTSFGFAYGSGVKKQIGYDELSSNIQKSTTTLTNPKKPVMIDLLFAVENSYQWHKQNLSKNPDHYSSMSFFGSNFIARYQEHYGAKVYFNTLVPVEEDNSLIKYGVISTKDIIIDLLDWKDLYVAG